MAIVLNHTIVPSRDKEAGARFFAHIFGRTYDGLDGHFAPVQVNETLTFDYDDATDFESHHFAFHVSDGEFDEIFGRIQADDVVYGSGPMSPEDGQINHRWGGRGVYFRDPDGHLLEFFTRVPT